VDDGKLLRGFRRQRLLIELVLEDRFDGFVAPRDQPLPFLFDRPWPIWPWVVLAVLFAWALVAPATLDPFYKSWMKLGLLLGRVTTPVILTLVFLVAILPASILLRLARKDFMRRQFEDSPTYRIKSRQPPAENMEKPY